MKRFTETYKWNNPWFRKLSPKEKLFWIYICENCDNAGVWKIDYEMASFFIGDNIDKSIVDKMNAGKTRLYLFDNNQSLLIRGYIGFQVGDIFAPRLTNLQINCRNLIDNYIKNGKLSIQDFEFTRSKHVDNGLTTSIGIGKGIGKGKSRDKYNIIDDKEFIASLKNNPAYKDIDIDKELSRMDAWLSTRPGRKKTRRFIVNWLNKIDKPVSTPVKTEQKKEGKYDPRYKAAIDKLTKKVLLGNEAKKK